MERTTLGLSPEVLAVVVALLTTFAMRVLDALLPKDHHFRWVDKFLARDKPDQPDEEDET